MEAAHSVLAYQKQWVLNEKGMVARARLRDQAELILGSGDARSLHTAIGAITAHVERLAPR